MVWLVWRIYHSSCSRYFCGWTWCVGHQVLRGLFIFVSLVCNWMSMLSAEANIGLECKVLFIILLGRHWVSHLLSYVRPLNIVLWRFQFFHSSSRRYYIITIDFVTIIERIWCYKLLCKEFVSCQIWKLANEKSCISELTSFCKQFFKLFWWKQICV